MDRTYRIWYLLAVVMALVPPGVRMLLWLRPTSAPVDAEMAKAGEVLFKHEWKVKDSLTPGGDGLGPVFNASSCVACHNQGGRLGASGGNEHNVTTFVVHGARGMASKSGVIHKQSTTGIVESETHLTAIALSVGASRQPPPPPPGGQHCNYVPPPPPLWHLSERNTPALFGSKLIDEIPERVIVGGERTQRIKAGFTTARDEKAPVGRALRLADGRIGRFGWKAQTASLADFVQGACANELGLSNPGAAQPIPLYKYGQAVQSTGYDLTQQQCDQLTAFCASLTRPVQRLPKDVSADQASAGKTLFTQVGCADCHTPKLGSVDGIYSDLLLHRMGQDLIGGGSYGEPPAPLPGAPGGDPAPTPDEWRTPPLWGVADSAPYMHDGRAKTLIEAITLHGGQGKRSADKFSGLDVVEKNQLIGFLQTLRAP